MTNHIIAFATAFSITFTLLSVISLLRKYLKRRMKQKRLKREEKRLTESYGQKLLEFKVKNPDYYPSQSISAFMTIEECLQSNRFNPSANQIRNGNKKQ